MKEPSHGPEPCASLSVLIFVEISTVLTPNITIFYDSTHTVTLCIFIFIILPYNRWNFNTFRRFLCRFFDNSP